MSDMTFGMGGRNVPEQKGMMRCEREGCTNEIERGRLFMADVYDERRLMPLSPSFDWTGEKDEEGNKIPKGEWVDGIFVPKYKGHKQHWCEFCYRSLENNKYILHYTVQDRTMVPVKVIRREDQPADVRQLETVRDYELTKAVDSRKLPDPTKNLKKKEKVEKNVGRGNTKSS